MYCYNKKMTRISRTGKKIPSMRRYVAPLLIVAWVFSGRSRATL